MIIKTILIYKLFIILDWLQTKKKKKKWTKQDKENYQSMAKTTYLDKEETEIIKEVNKIWTIIEIIGKIDQWWASIQADIMISQIHLLCTQWQLQSHLWAKWVKARQCLKGILIWLKKNVLREISIDINDTWPGNIKDRLRSRDKSYLDKQNQH